MRKNMCAAAARGNTARFGQCAVVWLLVLFYTPNASFSFGLVLSNREKESYSTNGLFGRAACGPFFDAPFPRGGTKGAGAFFPRSAAPPFRGLAIFLSEN